MIEQRKRLLLGGRVFGLLFIEEHHSVIYRFVALRIHQVLIHCLKLDVMFSDYISLADSLLEAQSLPKPVIFKALLGLPFQAVVSSFALDTILFISHIQLGLLLQGY